MTNGRSSSTGRVGLSTPPALRGGFTGLRACGIALGLLLVLFVLADYAFRPTFVSINVDSDETSRPTPALVSAIHFFVQFAVAAPILRIMVLDHVDLRRMRGFALACGAVVLTATLSLFAHPDAKAAINLATVAWTCAIYGLLASSDYGRDRGMRDILATFAVGGALILLIVAVEAEYSWGRLAGRVGPNYWGMISFATFTASFALPKVWQRVPIWVIDGYVLVEASARGSLLALFVAAGVIYAFKVRHTPAMRRGWVIVPVVAGVVLLPLVVPFVASHLLLLNDARRGVGSGGTGRSIAWGQAFALFKAQPWLGVGFRQHRQYITIASSAHNAYLASLAEVGLPGFIAYLALILGASYRAVRTAWRRPDIQFAMVAGFLIAFVLIGFVESVWLTLGSPLPFLMLLFAAQSWSWPVGATDWRERVLRTRSSEVRMAAHRNPTRPA